MLSHTRDSNGTARKKFVDRNIVEAIFRYYWYCILNLNCALILNLNKFRGIFWN